MIINEILNSKVDYEVIKASRSTFVTKGKIGDRVIEVEISDVNDDGYWEISFGEIKPNGRRTYDLTSSGNEFEVLAMVKSSIEEFVQRYAPDFFYFTSENEQKNTRSKAYERLVNRFKIANYVRDDSVISHVGADGHTPFGFKRKNTNIKENMRFTHFKDKALTESTSNIKEIRFMDVQVFAEEAWKKGLPDKIDFLYKLPSGESFKLTFEQEDAEVQGRPGKQKAIFTYGYVRGIPEALEKVLLTLDSMSDDYAHYEEMDTTTSFSVEVHFKPEGKVEINGNK